MDLAVRWHRLLRALAFVAGLVLGLGLAVFIFSNTAPVDIRWTVPSNDGPVFSVTLPGVSLWLLAVVPLLVGGVVGYFYQTPARMHHVREAFRHRSRVHELEHELKELRASLDKVLMMPDENAVAVPPALLPEPEKKVAEVSLPEEPSAAELLKDFPDPEAPAPAPAKAHRPAARRNGARAHVTAAEMAPPAQPAASKPARRTRSSKPAEKN